MLKYFEIKRKARTEARRGKDLLGDPESELRPKTER